MRNIFKIHMSIFVTGAYAKINLDHVINEVEWLYLTCPRRQFILLIFCHCKYNS